MPNQIGPDDYNSSDWFRTEYAARRIGIIIISIIAAVLKYVTPSTDGPNSN